MTIRHMIEPRRLSNDVRAISINKVHRLLELGPIILITTRDKDAPQMP